MNKSKNFSGQPIIKQVLNFLDTKDIYRTAKKHNSDRYTKSFTTYDHLVTMIFAVISGCSSLREGHQHNARLRGEDQPFGAKGLSKAQHIVGCQQAKELRSLCGYLRRPL
ncbi:DUF4372 domain-containing protein [Gelidibacter sp.]|uniref:DUF4372 domain-containing protein n=1 Tax=Gelidibacter sp. TaxID=2018083 RepID=UPI003262F665